MSIKTPQQHRLDVIIGFAYTLGNAMSKEKWRVAQDFAATIVLGAIAFYAMRQSFPLTSLFATLGIGTLNTITVGQLYKAIREVQAENREQLVEDK